MRILRDWAVVVFDGTEKRGWADEVKAAGLLKVIYSGPGVDADSKLEQLIKKSTAPRRLVVVSSDRQVRKAARRRRAKSLSSLDYLQEMIKRHNRPAPEPKDPWEKRHGVGEGQLDQWLEIFGIDPDDEGDPTDLIRF